MAVHGRPRAHGGEVSPLPAQDEPPVLEPPLHLLAFLVAQGLGEGAGDREQAVGATRRFGDSTGKEVVWREPFRKRRNRAGDNG